MGAEDGRAGAPEDIHHTEGPFHDVRELQPGLCNYLEGWDGEVGGREAQEGGDICIPMADSC